MVTTRDKALTANLGERYLWKAMSDSSSAREQVTGILNGDSPIPQDVRDLVDSGRSKFARGSGYHEMAACVMILLRKIEAIEGQLNPEDDA